MCSVNAQLCAHLFGGSRNAQIDHMKTPCSLPHGASTRHTARPHPVPDHATTHRYATPNTHTDKSKSNRQCHPKSTTSSPRSHPARIQNQTRTAGPASRLQLKQFAQAPPPGQVPLPLPHPPVQSSPAPLLSEPHPPERSFCRRRQTTRLPPRKCATSPRGQGLGTISTATQRYDLYDLGGRGV
jgi:hypothetical protein